MPLKKKYPWNVLIFPAASEVALEIHRALRNSKEAILFGANQPGVSAATFHFERLLELPSIHHPDCLPHLQRLVREHKIDAIFPAYDDILLWLAERADQLDAEIMTSPAATVSICRSKSATYKALDGIVPTPRVWSLDDPDLRFSVFVKPDRGQGSQRVKLVNSFAELKMALTAEPDLLVSEYLPGVEYTVDCFSQRGRGVLYAQARARVQTKAGIATLTHLEELPWAMKWAQRISGHFDMHGAWFFQVKANAQNEFRLLEVAPRIAGSMALNRINGPNFPLLMLYEAAGHDIRIDTIDFSMPMGRSLDVRFIYDRPVEALYIDLDDTLTLRGKVNIQLIALIFQFRNKGIPVHLITRHKANLETTLTEFRLAQLFDRIVHIPGDEIPKAKFITEKNAVLIDDSFQERHTATKLCGIRCFDAAGAICLLDERA